MASVSGRPANTEFAPYYNTYIGRISGEDVISALESQLAESLVFFRAIDDAKSRTSYAPGKWTVREVLGHIIDTERVMAYRALRFSRNDKTPIEGFEQDDFIRGASYNEIPMADLLREFELVRRANIEMFRKLKPEAWQRIGTANEKQISVRALAFVIAGHENYHRDIVREKYLASAATQGR